MFRFLLLLSQDTWEQKAWHNYKLGSYEMCSISHICGFVNLVACASYLSYFCYGQIYSNNFTSSPDCFFCVRVNFHGTTFYLNSPLESNRIEYWSVKPSYLEVFPKKQPPIPKHLAMGKNIIMNYKNTV